MGRQKRTEKINDIGKCNYTIGQGSPLPLGVSIVGETLNFAVESEADDLEVLFFRKTDWECNECIRIKFPDEQKLGNVRYMSILGINPEEYDYNFFEAGNVFTDKRAVKIIGREVWGQRRCITEAIRSGFICDDFDWRTDRKPETKFEDTIIYRMHVRGFTMHEASGVRDKGTFKGIIEKIPYLKSLGITYVELMPAYEFDEVLKLDYPAYFADRAESGDVPLNYWGYADAYYFAPKQAYAAGDAVTEFKEMVRALHKEGIELGMEFYFAPGTSGYFIIDCLRYWLLNYHVDGFHVNTEVVPAGIVASDPLLASVKLFASDWQGACGIYGNIAGWDRRFMCDARRFLKGDEGMVEPFVSDMLNNPAECAVVNFLADHNSFTVKDMVSYEKKHNEANGEKNNDGDNYNFSWNCGVEGDTRKRKVLDCRQKQMKNAWVMLLCSQGIPMIMAGDEFGRTQSGNNNPYCQDNEISWINWKLLKNNKKMYEFVRQLIVFRKGNKILHMKKKLMQTDSMSCGYPDVSLHGIRAWYPDMEYCSRHIGLLFCGRYAEKQNYIYVVFNMYWEKQKLALPGLPAGMEWKLFLCTDREAVSIIMEDRTCDVSARSACIFISQKSL